MRFKIYIVLVIQILFPIVSYGQQKDLIQNSTLGIHFFINDHFGGNAFRTNTKSETKKLFPGLGLSLTKGISQHLDWNIMIYGTFADSIIKNKQPNPKKDLFIDANFSIRAKTFSNTKRYQPFFQLGMGVSQYKHYTGVVAPISGGLQINVFQDVYIIVQTKYSYPIGSGFRDYFSHSLGIAGVIGRKKRKPPMKSITSPGTAVSIPLDKDHDGILDTVDNCPKNPGLKEFNGCPDNDRDGVPDRVDDCPFIPGLIEYKGCPAPDTDKDGILDIADKCVDVPGLKEYQGCPEIDRDHDGIGDKQDE